LSTRSITRAALLAALLVSATVVPSPSPAANPPRAEEHCGVIAVGVAEDGEMRTTEPFCSVDRAMVRAVAHVVAPAAMALAVHFDLPSFAGSSFTVFGNVCNGSWQNLGAGWNNRIGSTSQACARVRHFDGLVLTGALETTFGSGGSLTDLNNRASSVQYSS
jgi:hypothetical protein